MWWKTCADRIGAGLTAVVSVKLDRAERLGNWFEEQSERVAGVVGRIVRGVHED